MLLREVRSTSAPSALACGGSVIAGDGCGSEAGAPRSVSLSAPFPQAQRESVIQKSQAALTEAVLETVQGMSVVKSFNLTGKGDKKLQDALEYNRASNLNVEHVMTPYTAAQEAVLQIAGVGMMLAAIRFCIGGSMTLVRQRAEAGFLRG